MRFLFLLLYVCTYPSRRARLVTLVLRRRAHWQRLRRTGRPGPQALRTPVRLSRALADLAQHVNDLRLGPGRWGTLLGPGAELCLCWLITDLLTRAACHDRAGDTAAARADVSDALAALRRCIRLRRTVSTRRLRLAHDLTTSLSDAGSLDAGRLLGETAARLATAITASSHEYQSGLLELFFAVQRARMETAGRQRLDQHVLNGVVALSSQVRTSTRDQPEACFRCTRHLSAILDDLFELLGDPADRDESARLRRWLREQDAPFQAAESDDLWIEYVTVSTDPVELRTDAAAVARGRADFGSLVERLPSEHPLRAVHLAAYVDTRLALYETKAETKAEAEQRTALLEAALRAAEDCVRSQNRPAQRAVAELRVSRVLRTQAAAQHGTDPRAAGRALDRAVSIAARACSRIRPDTLDHALGQHVHGQALAQRFRATGHAADRDLAIACLRRALDGPGLHAVRIAAARALADVHAHRPDWTGAATALGDAVKLLDGFAPARLAHRSRERILENVKALASDAAAAELNRGSAAHALAVLERGRCVIFSQAQQEAHDLAGAGRDEPAA